MNSLIKILIALAMALVLTSASHAEIMTSDPQEGVTSHETTVHDMNLTLSTPANADGSLNLDLNQFTPGWHDAEVRSCEDWVVEDQTSGNITRQVQCSPPAPVRFKVPNPGSAAGFKITQ